MQQIYHKVRSVPTPLGGLALGIASLGWCFENALSLQGYGQMVGAMIAIVLVLLLLSRFILHPDTLWNDLKHPALGGVLPTWAMTSMVISKMIDGYFPEIGVVIWLVAVVVHLLFFVVFMYHRIAKFSMEHVLPSWFVPSVGLVVAVVTCPSDKYTDFAFILLMIGLISYAFLLPAVIYRLIFVTEIPDGMKPTIALLAAPASLLLVGYLNIVVTPSPLIIALLLGIALLMTIVVYCALFKLLRLPFSPGFSAFTFPLAIGATALYKLADLAQTYAATVTMSQQLRFLANIELLIATVMIAYVSIGYIRFYTVKQSTL